MNLNKHYKKESPILNLLGLGGGVGSSLVGGGSEFWIATLGGSNEERGHDIAIDSNENIFVVGRTSSEGPGDKSGYIAKFDNLGTLDWQRTLGGTSQDQFYGVTIGSSDDVYVYKSVDPKQIHNELSVTVYFDSDVELDDAIAFFGSYLMEMSNEWTVDMWSVANDD